MGDLVRLEAKGLVPATVAELGRKAERTFVEFFVAHLSNEHTRRAYAHAAAHLSDWLEVQGWSLAEIEPVEAAAYIEFLKHEGKATSTIKARLAALRNLCDYMTSKGVLEWNPFSVVRAPRMSAGEGKTPILEAEDVRALFESIGTDDVIDLRDRAILSLMLYTFARVGAVVKVDGRHYETGTARASIALLATSASTNPTRSGLATSRTSGRSKAGCTWRSSSTSSPAASSAGPSPTTCAPSSSSMLSTPPWAAARPLNPACSFTPTAAHSTRPTRSKPRCATRASNAA